MPFPIFPTGGQIEALEALKQYDDRIVFAWLAFARSVEPGFKYHSRNGSLSSVQFNAVLIMRDCPDERLSLWLSTARSSST